jgi:hypothetical protein
MSWGKVDEKAANERSAMAFEAEAVAKSKSAAAKLREHQDTLNEFERLFQAAQLAAIEADEEAAGYRGNSRDMRNWLRGRSEFTHAEVARLRDNLKFYRLTWLT